MRIRSQGAFFVAVFLSVGTAHSQQRHGPVDIDLDASPESHIAVSGVCKQPGESPEPLRVSRVEVTGAWAGKIALPIASGDLLTEERSSAAIHAVRDAVASRSSASYFKSLGEVEVVVVTTDCDRSGPAGTVGFLIEPHMVHLSVIRVGDNVLPIPRLRNPPAFDDISPLMRTLMPAVGVGYDNARGATWSVAAAPKFILPIGSSAEHSVGAILAATQSVHDSLYDDHAAVNYQWTPVDERVRALSVSMQNNRVREPLGVSVHQHGSNEVDVGVVLKLAPRTRMYLNAGVARNHDRLIDDATPAVSSSEDQQSARILFEGIPDRIDGFGRAAIWLLNRDGYRQAVARAGYAKEISVRPNQAIGLEFKIGAGRSWGQTPDYARFFGGAESSQFLYDDASSSQMITLPSGPILRSFGVNAAHLTPLSSPGGTHFWHANLDISFPLPWWSYPLIPDESTGVPGADGNDLTLKGLLQRQIDVSGRSFLAATLKSQGMTQEQASARADEVIDEIQPASHYVINDANVFAIKPLLIIDAANLSTSQASQTWIAAGAGLQAIVLTARFEAGYAQTLHGPTFGTRGAGFGRLVFQRLF